MRFSSFSRNNGDIITMKTLGSTVSLALLSVSLASGCGSSTHNSSVDVVNLPHTQVKWQSIGNCWAYAFAGWAESVVLGATNGQKVINISESYITYRHYENQLNGGGDIREVQTGGNFESAKSTAIRKGIILEGDFIPSENSATYSAIQKSATNYLNESLKTGALSKSKDANTVRAELNRAFGVDLASLQSKIISASSLPGGLDVNGKVVNLEEKMRAMPSIYWPGSASSGRTENETIFYSKTRTAEEQAVLKRVKRALNDGHPVVMDWFVDFNALSQGGIFSQAQLLKRGNGKQGYHSTVLEDYVVKVKNDDGTERIIGEGEASPEDKKLALDKGEILYFVLKNSWGGSERLDRSSYTRDGEKGYHRLEADYIFSAVKVIDEDNGSYKYHDNVLQSFHLPSGY